MIRLIIFDVDGTLAEKFTLRLLPGVEPFFRLVFRGGCPAAPRLAIATNQGGVGLRYWMEQGGWGSPQGYPTVEEIEERLLKLALTLTEGDPKEAGRLLLYSAFAYQDRKGRWGPTPPGLGTDPRWQPGWRKPGAGMLQAAMRDAGATPEDSLMVGDSDDDRAAAQAAGCRFAWAGDFFATPRSACEALDAVLNVQ